MTRTHVVVSPPPVPPGQKISTDEKVDGSGNTVQDQIIRVGGAAVTELADVRNTTPGVSDYGAVVRIAGTVDTELAASDPLVTSFGTAADAAAVAGDVGTLQAKVRLLTGQLATMLSNLTTLIGHVDGLEGFVDGLEGLITTLNGLVDGLEATATTLNGLVDGLEGSIGTTADAAATAGSTGSLSAKQRLMTSLLDSINTKALTDTQLRASAVPVSGPLTDAQLRATPVAVSGTITSSGGATEATLSAIGSLIVTIQGYVDGIEAALATLNAKDFLTNAQLRATSVPVTPIGGWGDVAHDAGTVSGNTQRMTLATDDAAVESLAAIAASVDGLEGLATTLNTLVDGLEGYVDGLEAALATLNAKDFATQATLATLSATATTIVGHVDGIEAALTTIQGYVDGLEAAFATLNAKDFATQTTLAAVAASASVLDDWDETDRAKVNPIAGQAGVQGASGVATALTQRVVLATDIALPAGANAIGKLAANSGVDIGDVDVLTVPPASNRSVSTTVSAAYVGVSMNTEGLATAILNIAGTWVGTITLQGSADNVTYFPIMGHLLVDGRVVGGSVTGNSAIVFPVGGYKSVLAYFTTYTSGSATISWSGSAAPHVLMDVNIDSVGQSEFFSVAASITAVTLLNSYPARRQALISNDSASATLFVGVGFTASATAFSVKLGPGAFYELPHPIFTGIITGIWTAAVGSAKLTQMY